MVKWINKLQYIQTVEYLRAVKKKKLPLHIIARTIHSVIMLNDRIQTQTVIHCQFVYVKFENRQNKFMVRRVKAMVTSGGSIDRE